jgi:hypothetical protein
MKHFKYVLPVLMVFFSGCRQKDNPAEIPGTEDLYSNIRYLDSLTHSREVDSISRVCDGLTAYLDAYAGQAPTPDDKAVLDSLEKIHVVANTYLRFCIDTRANLELLNQDTKSIENQFKSGEINAQTYVSSLLGDEQIMVDLKLQLEEHRIKALQSLSVQATLVRMLTPLPQLPSQ